MKSMKKLLGLLMVVCMLLSMAACGGGDEAPAAEDAPKAETAAEAKTEATEAPKPPLVSLVMKITRSKESKPGWRRLPTSMTRMATSQAGKK